MRYKRAHILLPENLAKEIDAIAGRRGRSAFLVKTAQEAVRRNRLLQFLESGTPVWKDEDHPELAQGTASWVSKIRKENEVRLGRDFHPPAAEHARRTVKRAAAVAAALRYWNFAR